MGSTKSAFEMTPAKGSRLYRLSWGTHYIRHRSGARYSLIEDIIDEACVGTELQPFSMLTPSHPGKSLAEVIAFAESLGPGIPPCAIVIRLVCSARPFFVRFCLGQQLAPVIRRMPVLEHTFGTCDTRRKRSRTRVWFLHVHPSINDDAALAVVAKE